MNKRETVLLIMLTFIFGEAIVFMVLALNQGDFGSLADWLSGMGSIGAIIGVYYQVNEQRKEFEQNRTANLTIAVWQQHIRRKEKSGSITILKDEELRFWATNTGDVVGSFKFIGFCKVTDFKKISNTDSNKSAEVRQQLIIDPDPIYGLQLNDREFERIEPKAVSKPIGVALDQIELNFKNEKNIYLLYMDPIGKLFKKEIFLT